MAQNLSTTLSITDNASRTLRRISGNVDGLTSNLNTAGNAANGLVNQVKNLVKAYAGFESTKALIGAADNYANATSRLALMAREGEKVADIQKMIFDSADRTFSNYNATVDMVGKLGVQAGRAFSNTQDVVNFTEQINKHLALAGTSGAAAEGAMIQLTQAMSNGVLRGEELNSVMDGMPTIAKVIEEHFHKMGDTRGIKAIAEEGKITADIVKAALYSAADDTNAKFASMNYTFTDMWNKFGLHANKALEPVFKRLGDITNSERFQTFVATAGAAVGILANVLVTALDNLISIATFVADNWQIVSPVIAIATAGLVAYTVATIATKLATYSLTAAVRSLTAAFLASPIGWVVAAVMALVAAYYLAVAAVNKLTGSTYNATGLMVGFFAGLWAYVKNVFINMANIALTVAEFLINVFQNPIYSLKKLFINFATNFLDACIAMASGWDGMATSIANAFVSAINIVIKAWNGFMNMLPDKIKTTLGISTGSEIGKVSSVTGGLKNIRNNLQGLAGKEPEGYKSLKRFAYTDVGEAAKAGYEMGKEFQNGFSKAENKDKEKTAAELLANANKGVNGLGNTAGSGATEAGKAAKKTADNTSKMVDQLYGTEEQLSYLRDVAERDAINKFTTAEIKVDMKNNNNINSGLDLDGITGMLANKLFDTMAVVAEGV